MTLKETLDKPLSFKRFFISVVLEEGLNTWSKHKPEVKNQD